MNDNTDQNQTIKMDQSNRPDISNSTNEVRPLLSRSSTENIALLNNQRLSSSNVDDIADDPEFAEIVREAENAIQNGVLPQRISIGSSGSYFVRNIAGKNIGVFKPKDEEPYGRFNPKWTKWLQRMLCPCCFGRSCLVHNQGYLSEVGASLIDSKLRLNIVPKTRVVRLVADSFNYPAYERHLITAKREINESVGRHMQGRRVFQPEGLHAKAGSFQLFVENYVDANVFLKQLEQNSFPDEVAIQFQQQFERLVVLDYIIRNTDRSTDNWLVKCEIKQSNDRDKLLQSLSNGQLQVEQQSDSNKNDDSANGSDKNSTTVNVRIAAIDNGLAFPFKHPDEWRAYPFHWAWLKQAKVPFSNEIKRHILPFISDMNFVQHELCDELQRLFAQDKSYDHRLVEKQLSVMRGQILNLAQAMRDGKSPFELVQMPVILVERLHTDTTAGRKQFKKKFNDRYPLFSWF